MAIPCAQVLLRQSTLPQDGDAGGLVLDWAEVDAEAMEHDAKKKELKKQEGKVAHSVNQVEKDKLARAELDHEARRIKLYNGYGKQVTPAFSQKTPGPMVSRVPSAQLYLATVSSPSLCSAVPVADTASATALAILSSQPSSSSVRWWRADIQ